MSDKIRKYVLPNLPYLFVFWFFSKIGTAYRIAPGTDFGTKLMGMLINANIRMYRNDHLKMYKITL